MPAKEVESAELRRGCLFFLLWIGAGVSLLVFTNEPPGDKVPSPDSFWPGKTYVSEDSYLITENYLPLRALGRRPDVRMYRESKIGDVNSVAGVLPPWQPFYVFDFALEEGTMSIGKGVRDDKHWVPFDDCFCWPTRECISIERPLPVYASFEDAKNDEAMEDEYTYRFLDHFKRNPKKGPNQVRWTKIPVLPVVERRDYTYWCILRPEGDSSGYKKCWIKVAGEETGVVFRMRTSRNEFAEYLADLYDLVNQFRNKARGLDASKGIVELWVSYASFGSKSQKGGTTSNRLQGILNPTGGIQGLISNQIQYDQMRAKLGELYKFDSNSDYWDDQDIAYPNVDLFP